VLLLDFAINQRLTTLPGLLRRLTIEQVFELKPLSYKNSLPMNWHQAIGLISTVALFSPVFAIIYFRMLSYKNYIPLLLYCLFAFCYNLMTEHYIDVPKSFERYSGILTNLLDFPLMFLFIMLFSTSQSNTKTMKLLLIIFLLFEILIISIEGFTIFSITIIMGPGVLLMFGFSLVFFVKYIKRSFVHQKALGKALMASAICFAYGWFIFIYVMYYLLKLPESQYIFGIYFIITIVYCSLLTTGIIIESKRKRKLEELLITKKELLRFFGEQKKPATSKKATGEWKFN